jgi:hypothetical protein
MEASAPAKPLAQAAPDTGTRSQTGALRNLIVIGAQRCGGVDPDFRHPRFEQERHQPARTTRASRVAMRLEQLGRSRRGRLLPANFWLVVDDRLPLKRTIKRPDVRAAIPDETLQALRRDAERPRELTGRSFENWTIRDT